MSDVTFLDKAPVDAGAVITPPKLAIAPKAGEEVDRFTVAEGVVKIAFPSGMSADSLDDLDEFFKLFIKKAKRRVAAG